MIVNIIIDCIVLGLTLLCFFEWYEKVTQLEDRHPGLHLGPKSFHHWHLGFILQFFVLLLGVSYWFLLIVILGQWWMWDDTEQHMIQLKQSQNGHAPDYISFWHAIYRDTIYRWFGSKVDLNG